MLSTTFVKFLWLSVSVPSICVPDSLFLDALLFCSLDVTSNLSNQLLCFIMLSYVSYFIIVYNYIYLISCLFILTLLLQEEEKKKTKKNYVFFEQYFTQNTHALYHFKQLKTTQI